MKRKAALLGPQLFRNLVGERCSAWSGACSVCGLPTSVNEIIGQGYSTSQDQIVRRSPQEQSSGILKRHQASDQAFNVHAASALNSQGSLAGCMTRRFLASGGKDSDQSKSSEAEKGLGRPQTTQEAKKAYRQELLRKHKDEKERLAQDKENGASLFTANRQQELELREQEELNPSEPTPEEKPLETGELSEEGKRLLKAILKENPTFGIVEPKSFTDEEISKEDIGKYLFIEKEFLPEIFATHLIREESFHPKGGCTSLSDELRHTKSEAVMYRDVIANLHKLVTSKTNKQLYLTGPPASGKSVALAVLVNMMRGTHWIVWYIPQALQLTHGGFFYENEENPGQWDTPESARLLMRYLVISNVARLSEMTTQDGRPIVEVIEESLQVQLDAKTVVDNFLAVKRAVCQADDVLIAIDNYQALYRPSQYGEWLSQHNRRSLDVSELRVGSAMRFLERKSLRNGVVVCAASRGGQFSPKMKIPMRGTLFNIPNFTMTEFQRLAYFYMLRGTTQELSAEEVRKYFFLLGANPKELKLYAGGVDWEPATHHPLLDLQMTEA